MNTITIEPPVFRAAVERKHGLTKLQVERARELAAQGRDYESACAQAAAKFDVRQYRETSPTVESTTKTWKQLVDARPELRCRIFD